MLHETFNPILDMLRLLTQPKRVRILADKIRVSQRRLIEDRDVPAGLIRHMHLMPLLAQPHERFTEHTAADPEVIRERVSRARMDGFAWTRDEYENFGAGVQIARPFGIGITDRLEMYAIVAVVFDPIRRYAVTAKLGDGVKVNGLRPRRRPRGTPSMILFGLGSGRREAAASLRTADALLAPGLSGLRMFGSAALDLAAVATGTARLRAPDHARFYPRRRALVATHRGRVPGSV